MGRDKAGLRFGAETLLQRAVRRLASAADPIVVSLAHDSPAVPLPPSAVAVRDEQAGQGPLLGLLAGFRQLRGASGGVVVVPVDLPFLTEGWIARLAAGLERARAVLYQEGEIRHALTAAYRLDLLPKLERIVAEGRRRPLELSDGEDPLILRVEDCASGDNGPPPLMDVDSPGAYRDALRLDGFGNPRGVAMTLSWEMPGGGLSELPLWAANAEEALALAGRVLPEESPALQTLRARGQPSLRDAGGQAVPWNQPLQTGNDVHLVRTG
jgi:molybdopterin-guanine dinucleotide biosynthesis protein A